jgi:hypothetical protein
MLAAGFLVPMCARYLVCEVRQRHGLRPFGGPAEAVYWLTIAALLVPASVVVAVLTSAGIGAVLGGIGAALLLGPGAAFVVYGARVRRIEDVDSPEPLAHRPAAAWPWLHACALDPNCRHDQGERLYIHPLRIFIDFEPNRRITR